MNLTCYCVFVKPASLMGMDIIINIINTLSASACLHVCVGLAPNNHHQIPLELGRKYYCIQVLIYCLYVKDYLFMKKEIFKKLNFEWTKQDRWTSGKHAHYEGIYYINRKWRHKKKCPCNSNDIHKHIFQWKSSAFNRI